MKTKVLAKSSEGKRTVVPLEETSEGKTEE